MADEIGLVEGNVRKEYLRTIEQQLRYKKAYSEIERELNDHMEDQKQAYLAQGMDEEEAELRAVKEMGDPVVVGEALDKVHRPQTDWSLIAMAVALSLFGIGMQCLIFPHMENERIATTYQSRTILYNLIGIAVMVAVFFFDYRILGKYVWRISGCLAAVPQPSTWWCRESVSCLLLRRQRRGSMEEIADGRCVQEYCF